MGGARVLQGADEPSRDAAAAIRDSGSAPEAETSSWALSDVVMMTMPDTEQKATYEEHIKQHLKKGNTELLDSVNQTLDRLNEDGTMDKMREEWIGL